MHRLECQIKPTLKRGVEWCHISSPIIRQADTPRHFFAKPIFVMPYSALIGTSLSAALISGKRRIYECYVLRPGQLWLWAVEEKIKTETIGSGEEHLHLRMLSDV